MTVSCQNHNCIPWARWVFNGETDKGEQTCQVGSGYLDTGKHHMLRSPLPRICWVVSCRNVSKIVMVECPGTFDTVLLSFLSFLCFFA